MKNAKQEITVGAQIIIYEQVVNTTNEGLTRQCTECSIDTVHELLTQGLHACSSIRLGNWLNQRYSMK